MLPFVILDVRNGGLVLLDLFLLDIGFVVPDHLALFLLLVDRFLVRGVW